MPSPCSRAFTLGLVLALMPAIGQAENLDKCIKGWHATEAGNYQAAVASFDACIKEGQLSDASLARTYRNIGIAERRAKQPQLALEAFSKAIALHPDDVASDYINRGNAYDDANQFDKAMADYDTALKLKPDEGEIFYNRGITYEHQKMFEKARAEFIAAYQHGLRSDLLFDRLVAYKLIEPKP